ncbi:MAG: protealysin inhibitor emfourin [Candidatus Promineifilaceae bacterium]|nr:protealysin inhibitor emfourin [Candidatus Promineifilaceae bacterium]
MGKRFWLILQFIVFLGTACGPAVRSASSIPTDVVIVYQQEGGFAGITKEWIILPDGTITAPGEEILTAEPNEIEELMNMSTSDDIFALKDTYVPKDHCCDQFIYTVTITDGAEEKTIRTSDGIQQPEELTELLTVIQQVIADAEASSR